jgi:hypothetical protein
VQGPSGPTGPTGPAGPPGPLGPIGPSGGGGSIIPGGTTNQVLHKVSNTDSDVSWHTLATSDISDFITATDTRIAVTKGAGNGIASLDSGGHVPLAQLSISTTNVTEGSSLYFTTQRAQDAVGSTLTNSSTITHAYNSGAHTITSIVNDNSLALSKLVNITTANFIGRNTAGTGSPELLSASTVKTMLNLSNTNSGDITLVGENYLTLSGQQVTLGAVNLSGSNVTGTLAASRFPALTGDITTSAGSLATTISSAVVTNAKLATMANNTIKANITGITSSPSDVTLTGLIDTLGTAQGGLLYRGLTAWNQLTPGTSGYFLQTSGTAANPVWAPVLIPSNNLSDVASVSTVRTNLGLGTAALKTSSSSGTTVASVSGTISTGHVATFSDTSGTIQDGGTLGTAAFAAASSFMAAANNLSELASASAARTNLGLGTAATQSTTSFLQVANNLSDLFSAPTARTNLGLGSASTQANSFFAQSANNLSDLASATSARTNLGLGSIAQLNSINLATNVTGTLQAANFPALVGDVSTIAGNLTTFISLAATSSTATIKGSDRWARQYYASDFGAKMDVQVLYDVVTTSGSRNISSPTYNFVTGDIGKSIVIKGFGLNSTAGQTVGNNGSVSTTIQSVSAGVATLTAIPGTTYTLGAATAYVGGTDDTTAINNALNYIRNTGGGKLIIGGSSFTLSNGNFAAGGVLASQILVPRNVVLSGINPQGTVLLQKSGSNVDFIISENFASLVGTGTQYGTSSAVPTSFGIENLFIDCQSTWDGRTVGNTSGRGICFYGPYQYMRNIFIINASDDGIWTENSGRNVYSLYDPKVEEEAYFDNITSRENKGKGWRFNGPNDSIITSYIGACNGDWNFYSDTNGVYYNGSSHISFMHTYFSNNGTGQRHGAYTNASNLYIDTDNMQIDSGAFGSIFGNLNFLNGGYKNLSPLKMNTGNIVIGNILGSVYAGAEMAPGLKFLDLGTQQAIKIGTALIDTSYTSVATTALYSQGAFNDVNLTVRANTTAGQTGADIGGTYQRIRLITEDIGTAMSYTTGSQNDLQVQAYLTGSHTGFSGNIASTDKVYVASPTSTGKHGFLFGSIFQVQTFPGAEKLVIGNSLRLPSATITASGTVTVSPSASYRLIINKTVAAATTVNLPAYPVNGDYYVVIDGKGDANTNNISITSTGGQNINGGSSVVKIMSAYGWAFVTFDGPTNQWLVKVI